MVLGSLQDRFGIEFYIALVRYGNEAAPANNNTYYLLTLAVEKADIRRTSFSGVAVDLVSTNLYLRRSLVGLLSTLPSSREMRGS